MTEKRSTGMGRNHRCRNHNARIMIQNVREPVLFQKIFPGKPKLFVYFRVRRKWFHTTNAIREPAASVFIRAKGNPIIQQFISLRSVQGNHHNNGFTILRLHFDFGINPYSRFVTSLIPFEII